MYIVNSEDYAQECLFQFVAQAVQVSVVIKVVNPVLIGRAAGSW